LSTNEPPLEVAPLVAGTAPRVHLVVQSEPQTGTRIDCRRVVTLLGSRPGCKVNVQGRGVSPVHLAIVNNGAQVVAVDLVTKGGTRLNGLKMEHEVLSHGDVLAIGRWKFEIEVQRPPDSGDADAHPFELEHTPRIVGLEHMGTGRMLQPNREICVLGRRSSCDIHISDNRVSRAHALLLSYFGYRAIFDLLSRNRTSVNDEPVQYRALQDNDIVKIGESQFRVRLVGTKVADRAPKTPMPVKASIALEPEESIPDLVDIETVEGAQRWPVADTL